MKKVLLIMLLSTMSITASAATLNIDEKNSLVSTKQNVTASQNNLPQEFVIDFDINTVPDTFTEYHIWETNPNGGESLVTFSQYELLDAGNNIVSSAVLAGLSAFSFAYETLADTAYKLKLFGSLGSSPTRVHLSGFAHTPIPAALWLFGPLMLGFMAYRKRFMQ